MNPPPSAVSGGFAILFVTAITFVALPKGHLWRKNYFLISLIYMTIVIYLWLSWTSQPLLHLPINYIITYTIYKKLLIDESSVSVFEDIWFTYLEPNIGLQITIWNSVLTFIDIAYGEVRWFINSTYFLQTIYNVAYLKLIW